MSRFSQFLEENIDDNKFQNSIITYPHEKETKVSLMEKIRGVEEMLQKEKSKGKFAAQSKLQYLQSRIEKLKKELLTV